MQTRRQKRKLLAEINVVPFIDVMLVLLIVFMITAPLISQGVKVELPKADAEPIKNNDELTLVVTIRADGNFFITLGEFSEEDPQAVGLDKIIEDVSKIMHQNSSVPVFLESDASIEYGQVMQLMATLVDAGVPEVHLITQPPE